MQKANNIKLKLIKVENLRNDVSISLFFLTCYASSYSFSMLTIAIFATVATIFHQFLAISSRSNVPLNFNGTLKSSLINFERLKKCSTIKRVEMRSNFAN